MWWGRKKVPTDIDASDEQPKAKGKVSIFIRRNSFQVELSFERSTWTVLCKGLFTLDVDIANYTLFSLGNGDDLNSWYLNVFDHTVCKTMLFASTAVFTYQIRTLNWCVMHASASARHIQTFSFHKRMGAPHIGKLCIITACEWQKLQSFF